MIFPVDKTEIRMPPDAKRLAVVKNGVVENIIIATPGFALPDAELIDADGASIGATWDGRAFKRPAVVEKAEPPRGPTIEDRLAAIEARVSAELAKIAK
jgi:hypothetical protein